MLLDVQMEQIHVAGNYRHYDSQILVADALLGVDLRIDQKRYRQLWTAVANARQGGD